MKTSALPHSRSHALVGLLVTPLFVEACVEPSFPASHSDRAVEAPNDASCGEACEDQVLPPARDGESPLDASLPPDAPQLPDGGWSGADSALPPVSLPVDASEDISGDASAGGTTAWKRLLEGTYLARARFYGRAGNNVGRIANEIVWRVNVELDGERNPRMHLHLCADRGQLESFAPPVKASFIAPESYPDRVLRVIEEGGAIRTQGDPVAVGYDELPPVACKPNTKVAARPEQVWISGGQCDCPSSNAPPTSANDCRVTDPDGDKHPGMTIETTGAVRSHEYIRTKDFSQLVNIKVNADRRHVASLAKVEELMQLGCSSARCAGTTLTICRPELNDVVFVPLESGASAAEWSCARLLKGLEDGTLLPPEPLKAKMDC